MDIYSSLMVPDPHPRAPLHLQRQKSSARKKRKSNFEALSDESEEEVADKEFYCFFVCDGGWGGFKGLKSKTLNLKNM